jgi:hypothetical protein
MGSPLVQAQEFVPGEAMVKFVSGSQGSVVVNRISQTSQPDLKELIPVTGRIRESTGIPLRVARVASGGWVVFSVDVDELTERVVGHLRERDNVADVQVNTDTPEKQAGIPCPNEILVRFLPNSPEARAIAPGPTDKEGSKAHLGTLVRELEQDSNSRLWFEVTEDSQLQLRVDLIVLTLDLVERLRALSEIEAAQPNFIVKALGVG